jgi:hypothetical protein
MVGGHRLLDHGGLTLGRLQLLELLLKSRNPFVLELAGALVFAAARRIGKLDAKLVKLGLEFLRVGELRLFGLLTARDIR